MRVDDSIQFYRSDPERNCCETAWSKRSRKQNLKGIVGSATPCSACCSLSGHATPQHWSSQRLATCSYSMTKRPRPTFSTTWSNCSANAPGLFFPRSARVPYQEEVTENANIAMRAEVLNEINRARKGLAIVTFGEALPNRSSANASSPNKPFPFHWERNTPWTSWMKSSLNTVSQS